MKSEAAARQNIRRITAFGLMPPYKSRRAMSEFNHKPGLLVLASTYPRWRGDHEPGFVHELCKRLTERFEVLVLTSSAPGAAARERMDGVEIIRYRYAPRRLETLVYGGGIATHLKRSPWKLIWVPGFILGQYLAARRLLKQRRIDIIHAHWLIPQGMIAWWLSRRAAPVPFVVTSHGGDLFGLSSAPMTAIKRKVAAASAAMTVVSSAMRDEAVRLGLAPPRLEVLPMGVDLTSRFVPGARVLRSKDEILFVGRFVEKKGLRHLLGVMSTVLARHATAHLTVAGFGPDEEVLRAQAQKLGVDGRVNFIGAVSQNELPSLYRRAALMVAPFVRAASGDQEGLGLVVIEAMGCECPILVGDVPATRDIPVERVCVTDHVALAAAIIRVLKDPEGAALAASEGRLRYLRRFDWSAVASAYTDLLQAANSSR